LPLPLRLKAAVHPILHDRYRALTSALVDVWRDLGIEVSLEATAMAEFLERWDRPGDVDVLLGRWAADYDDPDNFTFGLFHGKTGGLRSYFSSPEADRLLEEARG